MPIKLQENRDKVLRLLKQSQGRITLEKMAQELQLSTTVVKRCLALPSYRTGSLSQPIGKDQTDSLEDILSAERNLHGSRIPSPIDHAMATERTEQIQEALARLPKIQQQILTLTFGLDGGPSLSFAQISMNLDLKKSQAYGQYRAAIRQLRRNASAGNLRELIRV